MRVPITLCSLVLVATACGSETPSSFDTDAAPKDAAPDVTVADANDSGLPSFPDAASPDAAACDQIHIGILGNPGANASSNFQTWLTQAGTSVQRIQTTNATPLTAPDIAPFNVIILDSLTRDYTAGEAAIVKAFVEAGGGLVSMTGYNGTSTDFRANTLLAQFGVSYGGGLVNGPVTTFVSHPITKGLTSITFAGGYLVSEVGAPPYTRTPIGSIAAGNVAYAIQASKGRAFVWGDEWIEFDSEWSKLPEVKALWVNAFAWVVPTGCPLTPN